MKLSYNLTTQRLETLSDDETQLLPIKTLPRFYYQETKEVVLYLITGMKYVGMPDTLGTKYGTTSYLTINDQWGADVEPIVKSALTHIEGGKITFTVNCNTERFFEAINGKEKVEAVCEISSTVDNPIIGNIVGSFKIELFNRLHTDKRPTPTPSIKWCEDAPQDGKVYVRKDSTWVELNTSGTIVPDGALTDDAGNIITDDSGNTLINL